MKLKVVGSSPTECTTPQGSSSSTERQRRKLLKVAGLVPAFPTIFGDVAQQRKSTDSLLSEGGASCAPVPTTSRGGSSEKERQLRLEVARSIRALPTLCTLSSAVERDSVKAFEAGGSNPSECSNG